MIQDRSGGYKVTEVLELGKPAEEIIRLAEREKTDLVVVGAQGHGAVARLLLGSVSARTVEHSPSSVLIVR